MPPSRSPFLGSATWLRLRAGAAIVATLALLPLGGAPGERPAWPLFSDWSLSVARTVGIITAVLACGLAATLVWRLPRSPAVRRLASFLAHSALGYAIFRLPGWGGGLDTLRIAGSAVFAVWGAADLVDFARSFPRTLASDERGPRYRRRAARGHGRSEPARWALERLRSAGARLAPSTAARISTAIRRRRAYMQLQGRRNEKVYALRVARAEQLSARAAATGSRADALLAGLLRLTARLTRPGGADVPGYAVWITAGAVQVLLLITLMFDEVPLERTLRVTLFAGVAQAMVLAGANFFTHYTVCEGAERRKLLWIVQGVVVGGIPVAVAMYGGTAAILLAGPDPAVLGPVLQQVASLCLVSWVLFPCALVAGLGMAIFYEGALDPALALRRTAVYGVLGSVLVVAFAIVENATVNIVAARLGMDPAVGPWVAAASVALLFGPLRDRLRAWVDRRIDRLLSPRTLAEAAREEVTVAFADLVGYTAMAAVNERDALTLAALFHKVAGRTADRFGGRVVKTIGDAVLLTFPEPDRALDAGDALGHHLRTECEALRLATPELRVGIHRGEVAVDAKGDVFGDTVNIASRLQASAEPGEILVSQAVVVELARRERLEALGDRTLRSLPAPLSCFRLTPTPPAPVLKR